MKSSTTFTRFLWSQSWQQLIGVSALLFLAMSMVLFHPAFPNCWKESFANYLDPLIAIGTLIIASLVWFNEQRENWQAQLPKRLHIRYLLPEGDTWHTHVTVVNAPLTGESDIRQWGQSIGQTIFPQALQEGERADQNWARINFTGFRVIQIQGNPGIRNYGLLVFLAAPIKGADDGKVYTFAQDGARWQKSDKLPDDFPEEAFSGL